MIRGGKRKKRRYDDSVRGCRPPPSFRPFVRADVRSIKKNEDVMTTVTSIDLTQQYHMLLGPAGGWLGCGLGGVEG